MAVGFPKAFCTHTGNTEGA